MVVLVNASQTEKKRANTEIPEKMAEVVGSPSILS